MLQVPVVHVRVVVVSVLAKKVKMKRNENDPGMLSARRKRVIRGIKIVIQLVIRKRKRNEIVSVETNVVTKMNGKEVDMASAIVSASRFFY